MTTAGHCHIVSIVLKPVKKDPIAIQRDTLQPSTEPFHCLEDPSPAALRVARLVMRFSRQTAPLLSGPHLADKKGGSGQRMFADEDRNERIKNERTCLPAEVSELLVDALKSHDMRCERVSRWEKKKSLSPICFEAVG
jgi:hypothetical protein